MADSRSPSSCGNRFGARAVERQASISHAVVSSSIEDTVSGAHHVWLCFSGQEAVIQFFDKTLRYDIHRKLFIGCSTITPEATNELARKIIGAKLLTSEIFGQLGMVNAAILTYLLARAVDSV